MPRVIGKQIGTVTRAPKGVRATSPKKASKTFSDMTTRGAKAANTNHGDLKAPGVYGGGKNLNPRNPGTRRKGGGANTGAGATSPVSES